MGEDAVYYYFLGIQKAYSQYINIISSCFLEYVLNSTHLFSEILFPELYYNLLKETVKDAVNFTFRSSRLDNSLIRRYLIDVFTRIHQKIYCLCVYPLQPRDWDWTRHIWSQNRVYWTSKIHILVKKKMLFFFKFI